MNTLNLDFKEATQWKRSYRIYFRRIIFLTTLFTCGFALVGCGVNSGGEAGANGSSGAFGSGSGNTSGVDIRLSDAPSKYDWVARTDVNVTSIEARIADSSGSHWTTISSQPATINLLDLRGGISLMLGHIDIPNGSINQIRLVVASASVTLKDGRAYDLKIPSGSESGLKVMVDPPLQVVTGQLGELMLDFDVSRSFVALGNPRTMAEVTGFNFKPVVRVGNSTVHGSVSGEVYSDSCTPGDTSDDLALANAAVEVLDAQSNLVAASSSISSGAFAVFGIDEGSYSLHITSSGHDDKDWSDVAVYRGNITNAGRITLAKNSCSGSGSGSSTGTSTGTDTGTSTDTGTDTGTGTSTSTDTGTGSSTDTGTSTDTSTGTDTATSTDTSTDTSSSTATDPALIGPWSVQGFDAATQNNSLDVIWQTQVPTSAILNIGLSADNLTLQSIAVPNAAVSQLVTVAGLNPGTTYYLQVTATDAEGISRMSSILVKSTKIP